MFSFPFHVDAVGPSYPVNAGDMDCSSDNEEGTAQVVLISSDEDHVSSGLQVNTKHLPVNEHKKKQNHCTFRFQRFTLGFSDWCTASKN